ncbi:MAG: hypothetical protein L3J75_03175 [Methylococcaceae bacterium]|nr:hypothetical protein [Methylococcaceae bacterium]
MIAILLELLPSPHLTVLLRLRQSYQIGPGPNTAEFTGQTGNFGIIGFKARDGFNRINTRGFDFVQEAFSNFKWRTPSKFLLSDG